MHRLTPVSGNGTLPYTRTSGVRHTRLNHLAIRVPSITNIIVKLISMSTDKIY